MNINYNILEEKYILLFKHPKIFEFSMILSYSKEIKLLYFEKYWLIINVMFIRISDLHKLKKVY